MVGTDDGAWAGLLDTVVSSLTEGVTVLDASGAFLLTNAAAMTAMGFTDGTMPENREKIVALTADGEEFPIADRPSSRALNGETVLNLPVIHRGPTGDRMMRVSAVPLTPDPITGLARCVCIFHDVTAEHAARAELTAFATVVAHDLRGPLTTISAWADLAATELGTTGTLEPGFATDLVSRLQTAVGRMSTLIDDLHGHAVSRDQDLVVSTVDLHALVTEVVAAHEAEAHVRIEELGTICADRTLLRLAIDNVIVNALKFVAPGTEPDVRVSRPVDGAGLRLQVADNGIGVPEGAHGDIFGEFRRVHPDYPGTGLGLSIVRRVVERHDGTVTARANPSGVGTVVEIELPETTVIL